MQIKIRFYDVNDKLEIIEIGSLPKAKAIMAVHYFGLETDLTPFQDYCKIHNAFLIEDNAHGLLSRNSQGELLGTNGDIGIISIRKTLPIVNGAMLICPNGIGEVESYPSIKYESLIFTLKNFLRPMVAFVGFKILLQLVQFKRFINKQKTGSELPTSIDEDEKVISLDPSPIDIEYAFSRVDVENEQQRRRLLYVAILDLLKALPVTPLRFMLGENEVPYAFPFYCELGNYQQVQNKLNSIGLEIVQWPSLPTLVLANHPPKYYQSLYFVKFLW